MPVSQVELHNILTTSYSSQDVPDVWPTAVSPIDTSKVDMIADTLKQKLHSKIGGGDPEKIIRQIFNLTNSTELTPDTFVTMCAQRLNFGGHEEAIKSLFRRYDVDRTGKIDVLAFWSMLNNEANSRASTTIGKVREILAKRTGGISSLKTLGKQFSFLDKDKNGTLNKTELEEGLENLMRGFKVLLSKQEFTALFKQFDVDGSNSISYDEFLRGIRGNMNEHREQFVKKAFSILDLNQDGTLTLEELAKHYNVSEHPLVLSGRLSEADALRNFIAHWHIGNKSHTDIVTYEEFKEYYQWVSASIDSDEYFELMMRNAWHISGGKGSAQNTSNIRVLVTHEDGRQTVEELIDDFGIDRKDFEAIKKKLAQQGIKATSISLKD